MRRALSSFTLAALVLGSACADDVSRGWLVDKTRLLAARVEASGDPARASVAPSEKARVTWLVASPNPLPRLAFAWAACAPPQGSYPQPGCEGPVLASGSGTAAGDARGTVAMDIEVPAAAAHGDLGEIQLLAAFCPEAIPALDPRTFTAACASGAALLGSASLFLSGANRSPVIDDGDVTLDGRPLPASVGGEVNAPCVDASATPVVLSGGGERTFGFRFRDEQREPVDGRREALVLTHVVSTGVLDRTYSALDPDEAAPKEVTVPWKPPPARDVPEAGRLVEIFFVLRDGRGGTSFVRRTVCARPR